MNRRPVTQGLRRGPEATHVEVEVEGGQARRLLVRGAGDQDRLAVLRGEDLNEVADRLDDPDERDPGPDVVRELDAHVGRRRRREDARPMWRTCAARRCLFPGRPIVT
jgi:hypothetical protein